METRAPQVATVEVSTAQHAALAQLHHLPLLFTPPFRGIHARPWFPFHCATPVPTILEVLSSCQRGPL